MLYSGTRRSAYELRVLRQEDIPLFVNEIGVFGKEKAAAAALAMSQSKRPKVNADVVPTDAWELIETKKGTRSWADIARGLGHGRGFNLHVGFSSELSRRRLLEIAEVVDDDELRNLAASDIYWDRIVAIEYIGERQVYDLTVPETSQLRRRRHPRAQHDARDQHRRERRDRQAGPGRHLQHGDVRGAARASGC